MRFNNFLISTNFFNLNNHSILVVLHRINLLRAKFNIYFHLYVPCLISFSSQKSQTFLFNHTFGYATKNVFNGSSLGKQYRAKAIEERCGLKVAGKEKKEPQTEKLKTSRLLLNSETNNTIEGEKQHFTMLPKIENSIV